jgi:hypothetical protein
MNFKNSVTFCFETTFAMIWMYVDSFSIFNMKSNSADILVNK